MANISTLVKDIYGVFEKGIKPSEEEVMSFALALAKTIGGKFGRKPFAASLWMSNVGSKCQRKLWYSVHRHEKAEPLPASKHLSFMFGDILEQLLIFLVKLSGHTVTDQQKQVEFEGVRGRIDCRIDGELFDIKSSSTRGMDKFERNELRVRDDFSYLDQLFNYCAVEGVSRGHFLVIDKTLGNVLLDSYAYSGDADVRKKIETAKATIALPEPPARGYEDEPDGASGNRKLGTACSYCAFKSHCWPNLRTFIYSRGPVYLTRVSLLPKVPEVK